MMAFPKGPPPEKRPPGWKADLETVRDAHLESGHTQGTCQVCKAILRLETRLLERRRRGPFKRKGETGT